MLLDTTKRVIHRPFDDGGTRAVLSDPDVFGTTIFVYAFDRFVMPDLKRPEDERENPLGWTAECWRVEIAEECGVLLPEAAVDRFKAVIWALTTDDFTTRLPRFIRICNLLSGDGLDPDVWDPADSEEIAWALTEVSLLSPKEPEEFSDEIRAYIAAACREDGVSKPIGVLQIGLFQGDLDGLGEFTGDPDLYSMVNDVQQGKADDLQATIDARTRALFVQLERLPLHNGDSRGLLKRLTANGLS